MDSQIIIISIIHEVYYNYYFLRQYFIIAFKDDPFELWEIRSLTLLRAMTRHCPVITALVRIFTYFLYFTCDSVIR